MERMGCCKCCGQTMLIKVTDELREEFPEEVEELGRSVTEEEEEAAADNLATLTCKCREGRDMRQYRRRLKDCKDKIEAMFRDSYPEIADALQETKDAVIAGYIARIQVTDAATGGTASMFMKKDRLKIRWKKPVEMEIEAG